MTRLLTAGDDTFQGGEGREIIYGLGGDDLIFGGGGDDNLLGGAGGDALFGDAGSDRIVGGTGTDNLQGGAGNDVLFGGGGEREAVGTNLASDNLNGGDGNDVLVADDGNDVLTGGAGADTFAFKFTDPMVAAAAGTARAFASLTDFDAAQDRLTFDAAGVRGDQAGAGFVDGGAGDGTPGGIAATFYSGAAAGSAGQAVVVLTTEAFASGAAAVQAAQGEERGDLILYFNSTVGVASLLFVDGTDAAHSVARFTGINSVAELAAQNLTASDFLFV